jgi:hypothetical protein
MTHRSGSFRVAHSSDGGVHIEELRTGYGWTSLSLEASEPVNAIMQLSEKKG